MIGDDGARENVEKRGRMGKGKILLPKDGHLEPRKVCSHSDSYQNQDGTLYLRLHISFNPQNDFELSSLDA